MTMYHDVEYFRNMSNVLYNGHKREDRTGTGTKSIFGTDMRFDISDMSIPLLTTKEMNWNSIIHELLWFISGDTNTKYLNDNGVKIWNAWADADGELGPIYGYQWRKVFGIDQLANAIKMIKTDPTSRRIIVDSWDVSNIELMRLPPCHCFYQFFVEPYSSTTRLELLNQKNISERSELFEDDCIIHKIPKGKLSLKLTMRSSDIFLGLPFNIAQYSILNHIVAKLTGYDSGEFIYSGGDSHIYLDHLPQVKKQLRRDPSRYSSPILVLDDIGHIDRIKAEDISIEGYKSYDKLRASVSI